MSCNFDALSKPQKLSCERQGTLTSVDLDCLDMTELAKPVSEMEENVAAPNTSTANALQQFVEHFEAQDEAWHAAQSEKLLRKVDVRLLPTLVVIYALNFLDRSNLAQARQGNLEKDLHMKGTDFNLATSILFVGYFLMQLPSNMLITRVRPSLYLSGAMMIWGVVSTCNAAVHSFGGLIAVRFVLGFVEAPFFPGAIFLMSSWYTRAELTRRVSWFYSGNAIANIFGGVIAASVLGHLDGRLGIAGWRWLFIIVSEI